VASWNRNTGLWLPADWTTVFTTATSRDEIPTLTVSVWKHTNLNTAGGNHSESRWEMFGTVNWWIIYWQCDNCVIAGTWIAHQDHNVIAWTTYPLGEVNILPWRYESQRTDWRWLISCDQALSANWDPWNRQQYKIHSWVVMFHSWTSTAFYTEESTNMTRKIMLLPVVHTNATTSLWAGIVTVWTIDNTYSDL